MSAIPGHAVQASNPPELTPEKLIEERDRLVAATIEAAFALIERDWRGAVRAAYRAAWHFHRLPRAEQEAYVVSDLHDDDGPMPSTDDWSASAFVSWLVYRCNRSIEGTRRTEKPRFDEFGRKTTAVDAASLAHESSVNRHETNAPETPELTQKGMF